MNYENFNAVLTHIERHPEEHDQTNWCGTTCCLAGHGAAMALGTAHSFDVFSRHARGQYAEYVVYDIAAEWLGIDRYTDRSGARMAHWLFSGRRSIDDFRRVRLVEATRRLMALAAQS